MTIRVYWTEVERAAVLEKAAQLQKFGIYSSLDCLRKAQEEVLPAHRQRALKTHSACLDLIKSLRKMSLIVPSVVISSVKEPPAPTPAPAPVEPTILETSFDGLVSMIAERFAEALKHKVRGAVLELEAEFRVAKHDPSYESNHVSRPRVTIVGLLNDQEKKIEHEFGSLFQLKFLTADRAVGVKPADADAYLLMKNFISHSAYGKYRGFTNHVLIDGGMTSLRTWLHAKANEIIAKTNEQAKAH